MIATVTFNPSLDYIVRTQDFREGGLNRATAEEILPGGKGINVSIVLHALGIPTTGYGFVGGFTGEELGRMLSRLGVATDFIPVDGLTRINVKLKSDGKETEINGRGPVVSPALIDLLKARLGKLGKEDVLVLSGSIPKGMDAGLYAELAASLPDPATRFVVDASGPLLLDTLPLHPFLIKPNQDELAEIFSRPVRSPEDALGLARKLQERGARNVLVSLGGDGAVLVDEHGKEHRAQAPHGEVRNTVGCGDSMVAGFLAGYERTHDYAQALRWGIAAGSAAAFAGHLASGDEIKALLESR